MAKISGKDPGESYELPVEGPGQTLRIKSGKVNKPQNEGQGYLYMVESVFDDGENQGLRHWESFFTKGQFGDGLDGCRNLLQFACKIGLLKDGVEYDSDMFETDKFADAWPNKVVDRLYKADVKHKKDKQGTPRARSVKYAALKEASKDKEAPKKSQDDFDFEV